MLGIFDSHPVQYRAPLYRELERLAPGKFHVFYATDVSLRGHRDQGFGKLISWDESLMEGYPCTVLDQLSGDSLVASGSLHGWKIGRVFRRHALSAVLQTQFLYYYDLAVLLHARRRGIPVWIRHETQDEAFTRSAGKALIRSTAYRLLYTQVDHAFAIGELNRRHLLGHGIPEHRISMARYCTVDRFTDTSSSAIKDVGERMRERLGFSREDLVIGFFGKLIPKKNPSLILDAALRVAKHLGRPIRILLVGSGELEALLRDQAGNLTNHGISVTFAGFVSQSEIAGYYAATDILVLPSRRMGETWGLVVNEALQAGCSVAISDTVGCGMEFDSLPHCSVFPENDAEALGETLVALAENPPYDRAWAQAFMKGYSIHSAAAAVALKIRLSLT